MEIKKLIKEIHKNAVEKGFWETDITVHELIMTEKLRKALKNALVSQKIMLTVSELGEAIEALRTDNHGYEKKDTFEDEICDSIIRLFDICDGLNIDIERQIKWKMQYNKSRKNKHGKQF